MKIYASYDRAAGQYAPPFMFENDALAVRAFNEGVKNHPFRSDLSLYSLGEYNVETGAIISKVEFIANYTGE